MYDACRVAHTAIVNVYICNTCAAAAGAAGHVPAYRAQSSGSHYQRVNGRRFYCYEKSPTDHRLTWATASPGSCIITLDDKNESFQAAVLSNLLSNKLGKLVGVCSTV
ncbi:hypothetical protein EVAR_52079_1 [Eumeta japonica]|uniref:Uncharacterized protein n=1 Tax=Eumeta variegata TaxID=151549 RepID=A0A4C1Y423_EUMVA|nr:hypothetical protein EVAR_52079_1 [Eumeta japonica]